MPTPLACPVCHSPLSKHSFGTTQVSVCKEGCHGLWFDAGTLDKLDHDAKGIGYHLEEALYAEPVPAPEGRALDCPCCHTAMNVEHHEQVAGLQLDVCGTCGGVFLDAGEFAQLRARDWTAEEKRALSNRKRRRRARQQRMKSARTPGGNDVIDFLFLFDIFDSFDSFD